MACPRSVCCHSYVQGWREEALVSEAKREETLYGVAFKGANLLKMSLLTAAAMLVICLLALVETTHSAGANSLPQNGKIAFQSFSSANASNVEIYTMNPDGTG